MLPLQSWLTTTASAISPCEVIAVLIRASTKPLGCPNKEQRKCYENDSVRVRCLQGICMLQTTETAPLSLAETTTPLTLVFETTQRQWLFRLSFKKGNMITRFNANLELRILSWRKWWNTTPCWAKQLQDEANLTLATSVCIPEPLSFSPTYVFPCSQATWNSSWFWMTSSWKPRKSVPISQTHDDPKEEVAASPWQTQGEQILRSRCRQNRLRRRMLPDSILWMHNNFILANTTASTYKKNLVGGYFVWHLHILGVILSDICKTSSGLYSSR